MRRTRCSGHILLSSATTVIFVVVPPGFVVVEPVIVVVVAVEARRAWLVAHEGVFRAVHILSQGGWR